MNYQIFGERCSGNNLLESTLLLNFHTKRRGDRDTYIKRHFFGFDDLDNMDDCLFICIVRDPVNWINSLYRSPHFISKELYTDPKKFVTEEFCSWDLKSENGEGSYTIIKPTDGVEMKVYRENLKDRNIYTKERYKNVFEMRHTKLKYMIDDLPKLVKNYLLIKYEDLVDDFENTMKRIESAGLTPKSTTFTQIPKDKPVRYWMHCKPCRLLNVTYKDFIPEYEKKLGYIPSD